MNFRYKKDRRFGLVGAMWEAIRRRVFRARSVRVEVQTFAKPYAFKTAL
jgi:hypothetical protein